MDRELLVKVDEETSNKFGKKPEDRTLEELFERGVINLDKDSGPTSHQVVDYIKSILMIPKAGHSGTLDPKVTGVLLVGLGKATRLMEYMLKSNKEYVCLMYLHSAVEEDKIREVAKQFVGVIKQTPPIVSAVKRQEREREIYSLNILEIAEDKQYVLFRVACQHGTYIRKLCTDLGESMGTKAQMVELRRTKAGTIKENDNIISLDRLRNLYELYKEYDENSEIYMKELRRVIRPMEVVLSDMKKVYVRDSAVDTLCHGSDLAIPGVAKLDSNIELGDEVCLMTQKEELIGIGTAFLNSENVMKKKKGAFIKSHKVFMDVGTYPEYWKFEKDSK